MFDFDPFDMDMDGDVDGIDFLGFDYLMRHLLEPDELEDYHGLWGFAYSEPDYELERDHDVRGSKEELEDDYDSSYDYDIPGESFWPSLSELDEDHGNVYLSPQDKRELADYYEKRARRRGERVDAGYELPGRHHSLRHGAETARLADRFNAEVDNLMYDADGLERQDYLEYLHVHCPTDEQAADEFYERWGAELDDHNQGG